MGLSGGFPTGAASDDAVGIGVPDVELVVVCSGACEENFVTGGSADGVCGIPVGSGGIRGLPPAAVAKGDGPVGTSEEVTTRSSLQESHRLTISSWQRSIKLSLQLNPVLSRCLLIFHFFGKYSGSSQEMLSISGFLIKL